MQKYGEKVILLEDKQTQKSLALIIVRSVFDTTYSISMSAVTISNSCIHSTKA